LAPAARFGYQAGGFATPEERGERHGDAGEERVDPAPRGEGGREGDRVLQGRAGGRGGGADADRRRPADARGDQDRRRATDAVRRLPRVLRRRVARAERAVAGHAPPERAV